MPQLLATLRISTALAALAEAHVANVLPAAEDDSEHIDFQSWPGLFWLPPADDKPSEHDMLRLDDELAGLMEAADMPADQHGAHSTRPEPVSPMPGEIFTVGQYVSCMVGDIMLHAVQCLEVVLYCTMLALLCSVLHLVTCLTSAVGCQILPWFSFKSW